MSVVEAIRFYIQKIVSEPGMKVLLMDEETTSIVSMVYSHTEILKKEVYLIDRIGNDKREALANMSAICFLRPTDDSIRALAAELRNPKYTKYDLYFSNVLRSADLQILAEADEQEVVHEVKEVYADYLAINQHLFSFGVVGCVSHENPTTWNRDAFQRTSAALTSVLLSLKKKPLIRFQGSSELCQTLALEMYSTMDDRKSNHPLFDFAQSLDNQPLLLIVDRRDDPVTPLLNQWTYQAMVHELIGIEKNRVVINKKLKELQEQQGTQVTKPDAKDEIVNEVVMSAEQDDFYKSNMFSNFGEIGQNIRVLMAKFQETTQSSKKMESIADMKKFVENYPEFRRLSGTVSKHVNVVGEMSRIVDECELLDVSALEQEIACSNGHDAALGKVRDLIRNPKLRNLDRCRLVMLYALRYERNSSFALGELIDSLHTLEVPDNMIELVRVVLDYAGNGKPGRTSDIFGLEGAKGVIKKVFGNVKGVENIYTQHVPLLSQTLDAVVKGKLKETSYPYVQPPSRERYVPQEVILFVVGGVTYEESKAIASFTHDNPTFKVLLGGTTVHNLKSFSKEVKAATLGKA